MTLQKKKWTVNKISNSVRKEIENLDLRLKEEIIKNFECLEYNPFLGDVKKVKGKKDLYRKRIGEYRFYFRTIPQSNNIHILLFKYRGKIKAKNIVKRRDKLRMDRRTVLSTGAKGIMSRIKMSSWIRGHLRALFFREKEKTVFFPPKTGGLILILFYRNIFLSKTFKHLRIRPRYSLESLSLSIR